MPKIDFVLNVDDYETGYSYSLDAPEYEFLPKVDKETREQGCSLGLWNIDI